MKRIGYINGLRIKGSVTNLGRVSGVKRSNAGAVSLTAAPTTKFTKTGLTGTGAYTKVLTLGLTNIDGGRNYVYGKIYLKNTATVKHVVNVKAKTLGGTTTLLATSPTVKTKTKTFSNTAQIPFDYPGSLFISVNPAGGSLNTVKAINLQVNALTTELF